MAPRTRPQVTQTTLTQTPKPLFLASTIRNTQTPPIKTALTKSQTTTLQPPTQRTFTTTSPTPFKPTLSTQESPFRMSTTKPTNTAPPSFDDIYYSPYQPKRQWPPDMSKLSPKHQFRLERKYRRRAALKYARPKFMKAVTLGQWVVIGFVLIYAVLFMEWQTENTPFHGIREAFFDGLKAIFSAPPAPEPKRERNE
ncbi:hypothetical protein N7508_007733 [Penicillium antarcticum]|uniref:uncharacterized protein n=1 Tax=Penicillium antarcticum TaxID=416450 RepID=UPI0023822D9F|nr:uncharacterized protein N7508_007733 [Penicillium antarcticum]KAJ5297484.1 hypothetical protein N7508_007733 [Penicillium antarcticum]